MKFVFDIGSNYSRRDIAVAIGLPDLPNGGSWLTGYVQHEGVYFIFCGVGTPGRTGHDYGNYFDGDELHWSGKTGSRKAQPMIANMTASGAEVHVFWRENDRDPFTYAGLGRAVSVSNDVPVQVRWRFLNPYLGGEGTLPEELRPGEEIGTLAALQEGAVKQITVNAYERNPVARKACLAAHGHDCAVCGFDFEKVYGELGRGFIHVHHVRPLSTIGSTYVIDPVNDLVPLCPNCHAMVHRSDPPLGVRELQALMKA